jgi:hypothetical protein
MVSGQTVALGHVHRHQTVTVLVSETTLAIANALDVQLRGES